MILASAWLTHLSTETASDEMDDVVENHPDRAWRIILAIVGCAPDYDVLAAVAAGPVEDLIGRHGDSFMPLIAEEAKKNARLRVCLQAAYSEFSTELRTLIEGETADVRDLAVDPHANVSGEDLGLVMAWLHHSATAWSSTFLEEMTASDPAAAWDTLRVLAVFADEDERVRDDMFERAFEPFIKRHFTTYGEQLIALGRKSAAFRQWIRDRKRPVTEDAAVWAMFVADVAPVE